MIDGYTGDQRFFIGWAQVWARKYRDDELRKRLVTDPHSPSEYRTNGIVRNMPQFQQAFDVKPGDTLLLGRESSGVPTHVHDAADCRLVIPLQPGMRSLNVAMAAAIVAAEAQRQFGFPTDS